jgi:hypothetical protein
MQFKHVGEDGSRGRWAISIQQSVPVPETLNGNPKPETLQYSLWRVCGVQNSRMLQEFKRALLAVVASRNFIQSLIAVLAGNAVYFLLLMPYLPPAARHRRSQIDLGLVLDFWICLVMYGLLELIFRRKKSARTPERS